MFLIRKNLLQHLKNIHKIKMGGLDSTRGVGRPRLHGEVKVEPVKDDNKHKCPVCHRGYPILSSMARHMRMTHGEDADGVDKQLFGYECGM